MKRVGLSATLALIAFVASFLFPGIRVVGVPVSPALVVALVFLPGAFAAYEPRRLRLVSWCLLGLVLLMARNTLVYELELRDVLYLLLPLAAIGATAAVKLMVDTFGLERVQRWAMILCGINLLVMMAQATDFGEIITRLETLWNSNIAFVINDEREAQILWNTLPIRPPGFFPTGIFASTTIYIVCRSILLTQHRSWPLLIAMTTILMTANRTVAIIFLLYELIASMHATGVLRSSLRALALMLAAAATLAIIASVGGNLYLLTFLSEELGDGGVAYSASVVERMRTLEFFFAYAPEFLALGGFSSSDLANTEHVFDSELMLRSLQFGVTGLACMAVIVLVPRAGRRTPAWNFLFFFALFASLTTTFMTSIVYLMVIALYKEAVIRADFGNSPAMLQTQISAKKSYP